MATDSDPGVAAETLFAQMSEQEQDQAACFEVLRYYKKWISDLKDWVGGNSGRPEDGTVLNESNELDLPGEYSPSDMVWISIISAVDHLEACADIATHSSSMYATLTTARTTLVGSCQALWLMRGSVEERKAATLRLARNIYHHEQQSLSELLQIPGLKQTHPSDYEKFKERKTRCIDITTELLKMLRDAGITSSFPETFKDIISPTLADVYGSRSQEYLVAADLWRQGSMTAHSVLALSNPSTIQTRAIDPYGVPVVRYRVNYASQLNTVSTVYGIIVRTINDWHEKSQPSLATSHQ